MEETVTRQRGPGGGRKPKGEAARVASGWRIDEETSKRIRQLAAQHEWSINDVVNHLLKLGLEATPLE